MGEYGDWRVDSIVQRVTMEKNGRKESWRLFGRLPTARSKSPISVVFTDVPNYIKTFLCYYGAMGTFRYYYGVMTTLITFSAPKWSSQIRFHDVPECNFTIDGAFGRSWSLQSQILCALCFIQSLCTLYECLRCDYSRWC